VDCDIEETFGPEKLRDEVWGVEPPDEGYEMSEDTKQYLLSVGIDPETKDRKKAKLTVIKGKKQELV